MIWEDPGGVGREEAGPVMAGTRGVAGDPEDGDRPDDGRRREDVVLEAEGR